MKYMHERFPSMREIFFALCKSVDTPVALGCWLRFEHNQLALAQLEINPEHYQDADSFRLDYLVVSFLSKWKGLTTGLDLEEEAIRKFKTSEEQCRETNIRLRRSRREAIDSFIASILFESKRKIAAVLGPCSLFCIEPWFGWGPGATYEIPRRRAFVDTKISELPFCCTNLATELFKSVVGSDRHWSDALRAHQPLTKEQNSCRQDAVPKSAKTHRLIAIEPRANSFLQKGVGGYFRSRLKRVGINLDDQGPNQRGAKRAFLDGLATIDLKAASDTVALELVYELLPVDWALLLDDLRSKSVETMDGSTVTLEKFSSMGNGFTFELESLIFWAISRSVVDALSPGGEVLVYGDDIICPSACAKDLINVLAFIGFEVNVQKTYISGAFYESCGEHFFQGKEVTPIYQKETIAKASSFDGSSKSPKETSDHVELLRLGNRLMRYAWRYGSDYRLLQSIEGSWHLCWRGAGPLRRFQIPIGTEGDDGWVLPASEFEARRQDPNLGISCKVMVFPARRLPADERAHLAWDLRCRNVWRSDAPDSDDRPVSPALAKSLQDEPPLGDSVAIPSKTLVRCLAEGQRWVMPTWDFGVSF